MARLIVYSTDVMKIMGIGRTASFALMAKIRQTQMLEKGTKITAIDFSAYTRIALDIILAQLK